LVVRSRRPSLGCIAAVEGRVRVSVVGHGFSSTRSTAEAVRGSTPCPSTPTGQSAAGVAHALKCPLLPGILGDALSEVGHACGRVGDEFPVLSSHLAEGLRGVFTVATPVISDSTALVRMIGPHS
jgi:hypothetical protein